MAAKKDDLLQRIVESSKGSVVCLKTKFIGLTLQNGSGFFVAPDKIATNIHVIDKIATNLHVIEGIPEKTSIYNRISQAVHNLFHRLFRGSAGTAHTIEGVVGYDDKNDLVLLKVAETGTPLPFGDIDAVESDEQVYIVGYTRTQYKGIAGTISSKNNRNTEFQIRINGPHTQVDGHSGGPVLNSKGEVIGVVVAARGPKSNEGDRDVHSFVKVIPLTVLEPLLSNSGQVESIAAWRKRPQIRAYTKTDLGNRELKAGKPEKAIEYYDAALRLNPNLAETYLKRADTKEELGDLTGAITDYDMTIKLNPEEDAAHNNRGLAKYKLDDFAGAIADYDRAIKLDPEYAPTYRNRGRAKKALGQHEAAEADFAKAKELDTNTQK